MRRTACSANILLCPLTHPVCKQVAEVPNLKWQVNVLVSALEKLGCSSQSASALLNATTSHVGHSVHIPADERGGMETPIPLPQHLGGHMQDVSLHNAGLMPQHLSGEVSFSSDTIG